MRSADTYRAAKRQRVKAWAKDCGTKFIAMWRDEEVPLKTAPPSPFTYRLPKPSKAYTSNGNRECARRLRQGICPTS